MDKIQMSFIALLIVVIAIGSFVFSGCKSFEPFIIPNQPDECNDFYSILKYYSVEGKDSAFVGTVYNECKTARSTKYKEKIEKLCNQLHPDNIKEYQSCIKL